MADILPHDGVDVGHPQAADAAVPWTLRPVGRITKPGPYPETYGVTWDYEPIPDHGRYVIMSVEGVLDEVMGSLYLELPETPKNDADVLAICEALRRIAARLTKDA